MVTKKMGRPTLLTELTKKQLLTALTAGNYRDAAIAYAGISRATFYLWMARGEKEATGVYAELRDEVIKAEQQAEGQMVMIWRTKMATDYRAIRDFMERRYPARWARREILTHEGEIGQAPAETDLSQLSPEEWETFKTLRKKMQVPISSTA